MVGIRAQSGVQSLRTLATVSQVMLGLYLAIVSLLILSNAFSLWREMTARFSVFTAMQPGVALWLAVGFMLVALPVAPWIYRAHANLRDDGAPGLNYSPGWALGSFLVPVLNLFVPMKAMRELWNRSHGEEAHFAHVSVGDVGNWWTCLLTGSFIQAYLDFTVALDMTSPLRITVPIGVNTFLSLFSLLLLEGSAVFLWRIIRAVTRAQQSVTTVGDTFA